MAIEVKELIIKMTVKNTIPFRKEFSEKVNYDEKNKIIAECVEKVLQKLESKMER